MTRAAQLARCLDDVAGEPHARRRFPKFFTPVEVWNRCPECATQVRVHETQRRFDAARDRGLLRRDVNEALETMALEALESPL